jgi:hypothetical protein
MCTPLAKLAIGLSATMAIGFYYLAAAPPASAAIDVCGPGNFSSSCVPDSSPSPPSTDITSIPARPGTGSASSGITSTDSGANSATAGSRITNITNDNRANSAVGSRIANTNTNTRPDTAIARIPAISGSSGDPKPDSASVDVEADASIEAEFSTKYLHKRPRLEDNNYPRTGYCGSTPADRRRNHLFRQKTKQAGRSATVGRPKLLLVFNISPFLEARVFFWFLGKS